MQSHSHKRWCTVKELVPQIYLFISSKRQFNAWLNPSLWCCCNACCPAWHEFHIWATDKNPESEILDSSNADEQSCRGRGGRGSQMLSLAIFLSICSRILATLKKGTFFSSHDPCVSENISEFESWQRKGERFSCGCSSCTDPLKGSDRPDGPIRLPKSEECS